MKRRGFKLRGARFLIVVLAKRVTAKPAEHPDLARPGVRTGEWLSEEEMPERNVDGTPMINGVDLNGRPYGRSAAWEDDPWHVDAEHTCGSNPLGASFGPRRDIGASASQVVRNLYVVVIEGHARHARDSTSGSRPTRHHTRFHRSMSSRRVRRWRREAAAMRRRIGCWWFAFPCNALGSGTNSFATPEACR